MYCKQCGAMISDNNKFCGNCGAAVVSVYKHKDNFGSQRGIIAEVRNQYTAQTLNKKSKSKGWITVTLSVLFVFVVILSTVVILNKQDEKNTCSETVEQESTAADTLHDNVVDNNEEIILMMMAEDIAMDISNYPSTTKILTDSWTFEQKDLKYTTCCKFECSNAYGINETHVLAIVSEATSDGSKINPIDVAVDGAAIKTYNGG